MCVPMLSPTREPDAFTDSFAGQVRIASGSLNLRVTEELADHRHSTSVQGPPGGHEASSARARTTIRVLDPGRGRTKTGYMWTMVRDGLQEGAQIIDDLDE